MNQQESLFFDGEQESVYEPRQRNAAAEIYQQIEQDGAYGFLPPERSMLQGEKLIPRSRSFRASDGTWRWKTVLAIICFLLIVTGLLISAIPQRLTSPSQMPVPIHSGPAPHHHTFHVDAHPTLVLVNISANVQITVGDDDTVSVSGTEPYHRSNRFFGHEDIQAELTSNNEVVVTTQSIRESFRDDTEQSVDILVPAQADIVMRNIIGDINITGVSGQIQAATGQGDITLNSVVLNGASLLRTRDGNIRFNGSLDQLGTYNMATEDGSLDISLPSNASFYLQVENPFVNVDNDFQQNMVGSASQPVLDLSATDRIAIKQS